MRLEIVSKFFWPMLLRMQSKWNYFRAICTYAMSKHSANMR